MPLKVNTYLKRNLRWGALHCTLVDPANQTPERAGRTARDAETAGSHAILVGGSTGADHDRVDATVAAVQRMVDLPVVLFPSGADGITSRADAVFYIMMLNSKDPRFLVQEQLAAVDAIAEAGLETIPMGYVVVEPGGTVGQVGRADLVGRDDVALAVRYGRLARYYGMDYVYLEAGSGATEPVPSPMIRDVKAGSRLPVIVGGGIRDAAAAKRVVDAGADIFVTGNLLEGDVDVQKTLSGILKDSMADLKRRLGWGGSGST